MGEIPYIQAFSYLRLNLALCTTCKPKHVLLALKPSTSTSTLSSDFNQADKPPPYRQQAPPNPPLPVTYSAIFNGPSTSFFVIPFIAVTPHPHCSLGTSSSTSSFFIPFITATS
jgi:hypothetical protein